MKKKLIALLLVGAAATAGVFGLTGCKNGGSTDNGNYHSHNFVDEKCEICGKDYIPTEGLKYSLNAEDTGYEVIGKGTATGNDIIIPAEFNEKPVTSIGNYAFGWCSGLTSITIPDSVTSIGNYAFYNCWGLTSTTITDGVTSIGRYAFYRCSKLTSITIPNSVTFIGDYAFTNCPIETAIIPTIACSAIKNDKLKSVTITSGDCIGDSAFEDCSGLTSITIGNSVTRIGYRAFEGCSGLTSITIPDSVTSIGDYAFASCSGLTSITVGENNANFKSENDCLLSKDGKTLILGCKTSVIPDSVTSIGYRAFGWCSGLTSITIPDSVTSIGSSAFEGCSGLTSITIPDSVASIGSSAFEGCSGLTSITIPDSVTSIGDYAFRYCSGLTSITFEGTIEQWTAIEKGNLNYNTGNYTVQCTDGKLDKNGKEID